MEEELFYLFSRNYRNNRKEIGNKRWRAVSTAVLDNIANYQCFLELPTFREPNARKLLLHSYATVLANCFNGFHEETFLSLQTLSKIARARKHFEQATSSTEKIYFSVKDRNQLRAYQVKVILQWLFSSFNAYLVLWPAEIDIRDWI